MVSLLVSVVGIVLLTILFADMFYNNTVRLTQDELKVYMNTLASDSFSPDEEAAKAYAEQLDGCRVTFLSTDGTVIADSQIDASSAENHADRQEVEDALAGGDGFAVRKSATLRKSMIYYCRLFDGEDGQFLVRLSVSASSEFAVFTDALPTVVWFLFIDILICLLFTWIATSFILRPVEKLTREAATAGSKEVKTEYSELQPLAKMMTQMNAEINEKVEKMKEDRRLEKLVLNSMEHGIVIFRSASDVLLINKTAQRLLDYDLNDPIKCFETDIEIAEILAAREAASVYRKIEGRDYSLRFTFNEKTSVLLITDVTESMAAARSKNDFIANVTHEMNTPLTSIRGFAELIGAGSLPPEKTQHAAKTIIKQSDRLSDLIRRIINFSAIDSDELPDYELDLTELVHETVSAFEPKIGQRNLSLHIELAQGVKVMSRRERLIEIVNNLVSNAIRYNKDGGALYVTLEGGEVPVLTVRDTGVGISEENRERIFDRFYTVDKSHNGSGGGFGLGLAIVKKLCRKAGWKLSVDSKLGEGTAFSIIFEHKQ